MKNMHPIKQCRDSDNKTTLSATRNSPKENKNDRQVWWKTYRQSRKRQPRRLNVELIIRKSVWDTMKDYVCQCSMAGIAVIREGDIGSKLKSLYILVFVLSCIMLFCAMRTNFIDTFSTPLIITSESSTYPIKAIDFPAVAICNINRISKKALKNYAEEFYENLTTFNGQKMRQNKRNENIKFDDVYKYFLQYGQLIDFSNIDDLMTSNDYEKFETPQDTHRVVKTMKKLAPNCNEMLVRCAWAGRIVNCVELFTLRRTGMGHCCVFNYVLPYNDGSGTTAEVLRQHKKGKMQGLNVIMDPMLDDYAYPTRPSEGFDIYLFDPLNYADPIGSGRVIHRSVSPNEESYFELHSVQQYSSQEVRRYPKSTRKCLFHGEKANTYGRVYSYTTCLMKCRINTVYTLCKCVPYYLPISSDLASVCTLEQLQCLNKYKEKLMYQYPNDAETFDGLELEVEDSLPCPECLPDCEFTQHFSRAFKKPITLAEALGTRFQYKEHRNTFTYGYNLTGKCILSIYQATEDGDLIRLNVVLTWYEILSIVGSSAGILLGLSIVSVMEIIYFVILNFPHVLYKNFRKYY